MVQVLVPTGTGAAVTVTHGCDVDAMGSLRATLFLLAAASCGGEPVPPPLRGRPPPRGDGKVAIKWGDWAALEAAQAARAVASSAIRGAFTKKRRGIAPDAAPTKVQVARVRALCVARVDGWGGWGAFGDGIAVARPPVRGFVADVYVATAPRGATPRSVVVRYATDAAKVNGSRCGDWAACEAVAAAVGAAGCGSRLLWSGSDRGYHVSVFERLDAEMPDVEGLLVERVPNAAAFGRMAACAHRAAAAVRIESCGAIALRSPGARSHGDAAKKGIGGLVSRGRALGRTRLTREDAVVHADMTPRNVLNASGVFYAIDFESACKGFAALDLAFTFRRWRMSRAGRMPSYESRLALIRSYDATLDVTDALFDLEIGNALGMVLQHKCCTFEFAAKLLDLLEGAAGDAEMRERVAAVGAVSIWHGNKCEAEGGTWVRNARCLPGSVRKPVASEAYGAGPSH